MKVKEGYTLRQVVDENIVVPTGSEMTNFAGAIVLTETAAFVWNLLQNDITEEEIIKAVLAEYDVSEEEVKQDVGKLIEKLRSFDVLIEA